MPTNGAATVKWPEERWFKVVGELNKREAFMLYLLNRFYNSHPINSKFIYEAIGMDGTHETLRRRIRDFADSLRDHGAPVCSNGNGYWLAWDMQEYLDWQKAQKERRVYGFVKKGKQAQVVREAVSGQGSLFDLADDPAAAFRN